MRRFKLLYEYILKCADGTYYTGVSNDPEKREIQHNMGLNKDSYTYTRRPVTMVYAEGFTNYNLAIEWEKRIQKWSKKKKEALIENKLNELKKLSEYKNESSHKKFRGDQKEDAGVSTTLDLTTKIHPSVSTPVNHIIPTYIIQKYPGLEYIQINAPDP